MFRSNGTETGGHRFAECQSVEVARGVVPLEEPVVVHAEFVASGIIGLVLEPVRKCVLLDPLCVLDPDEALGAGARLPDPGPTEIDTLHFGPDAWNLEND